MEYNPDRWVIIRIEIPEETDSWKVLASWYGGYLGSDSWKLSSGITKIEDEGDYYRITNYSGSEYICNKSCYGMSAYTMSVYSAYDKNIEDSKTGSKISIVDEETVPLLMVNV